MAVSVRKKVTLAESQKQRARTLHWKDHFDDRISSALALVPARKCQAFPEFVPLSGGVPFARVQMVLTGGQSRHGLDLKAVLRVAHGPDFGGAMRDGGFQFRFSGHTRIKTGGACYAACVSTALC